MLKRTTNFAILSTAAACSGVNSRVGGTNRMSLHPATRPVLNTPRWRKDSPVNGTSASVGRLTRQR